MKWKVSPLILAFLPVTLAHGQSTPPAPADCGSTVIDTSLNLADLPQKQQALSLDFRNHSAVPCTLKGHAWLQETYGSTIPACWHDHCTEPISHEVPRAHPAFLLAPGATAHLDFQWSTDSSNPQCTKMTMLRSHFDSLQTEFPSESSPLLICSTVQISDLLPGESSAANATRELSARYLLSISLDTESLYSDETAHLTIHPPNGNPLHQASCPDIYLVLHGQPQLPRAPGVEPTTPCSAFGGPYRTQGTWNAGDPLSFDVVGETLQTAESIQWRFVDDQGHHQMLVAPLHFKVLSADTLQKHWGRNAGLAISLSVDRDPATYSVNEKIWCHIDWLNESASKRIGIDEMGSQIPWIVVEDAGHKEITSFSLFEGGSGNGWDPFQVEHGNPHSRAYDLPHTYIADENKPRLPLFAHPGTYFVYASWAPPTLLGKRNKKGPPGDGTTLGKNYATVKSDPIKLTILAPQAAAK